MAKIAINRWYIAITTPSRIRSSHYWFQWFFQLVVLFDAISLELPLGFFEGYDNLIVCLISFVLCLLSYIFCLMSFVLYLMSFILCLVVVFPFLCELIFSFRWLERNITLSREALMSCSSIGLHETCSSKKFNASSLFFSHLCLG